MTRPTKHRSIFGDGSDGSTYLTYEHEGTFTRDMQFRKVSMPEDFKLNGFRIYASEGITFRKSTRLSDAVFTAKVKI